jgi:ABC-type nickel/cobalt efflux system permease component RcnA
MEATEWIIVLVVVLVVAALAAWLVTQQRKKKQHEHAESLRQEAHQHASELPETQVRAREAEAQAERSRLEAERAAQQAREAQVAATQQQAVHEDRLRTADQIDPHVDTTTDDYTPGAGVRDDRDTTTLDADHPHRTDGSEGTHRT